MILNEPIDDVHRDSIEARDQLRLLFQEAQDRVAVWEPRDYEAGS